MIDKSCLLFDGDEDCNKCAARGIIYTCPVPCPDYQGFFPHDRQEDRDPFQEDQQRC